MAEAVRHGDVTWSSEFRYRRADDSYVEVLDRGSILRDPAGKALRFVGVMRDVSTQKAQEARQDLVARELAHRLNNTLAVVLGIVQQTQSRHLSADTFAEVLSARILALANANSAVVRSQWAGADLEELATVQLGAHLDGGRVRVEGPKVLLGLDVAQPFALALNELATNAIKHGALSAPTGAVELKWEMEARGGPDCLKVLWREQGGPPVDNPERSGLGSKLIERGIPGAKVERRFEPSGFSCSIELPLAKLRIVPGQQDAR
jgi:two-component sensor histidine kinase